EHDGPDDGGDRHEVAALEVKVEAREERVGRENRRLQIARVAQGRRGRKLEAFHGSVFPSTSEYKRPGSSCLWVSTRPQGQRTATRKGAAREGRKGAQEPGGA